MNYKVESLNTDELIRFSTCLCRCLELSKINSTLEITESNLSEDLARVTNDLNFYQFDWFLKHLGENNVINWDCYSEDGFIDADFMFGFDERIFEFVRKDILPRISQERQELLQRVEDLEKKVEDIYGFNPEAISSNIQGANDKANELLKIIQKNDMLKSLENPVLECVEYLNKINNVNTVFDDVYLNIIKPVREEGRNGVKATARWAVMSIIVATIVSTAISNWPSIVTAFKNFTTTQ